ncbi:hypothetical protein [Mucilaginibacter antarcticus]
MADIYQTDIQTVAEVTTANSKQVFGV